jgi:hypothetical protein
MPLVLDPPRDPNRRDRSVKPLQSRDSRVQVWSLCGGARLCHGCDRCCSLRTTDWMTAHHSLSGAGTWSTSSGGTRYAPACAISWQIAQLIGGAGVKWSLRSAAPAVRPANSRGRALPSKCRWVCVTKLCDTKATSAMSMTASKRRFTFAGKKHARWSQPGSAQSRRSADADRFMSGGLLAFIFSVVHHNEQPEFREVCNIVTFVNPERRAEQHAKPVQAS